MGDPIMCVACGHPNRETARFCEGCGAPVSLSCPECANELRPGAAFCDACGAPVAGTLPSGAPGGESRKVVTVVFADLVGSTELQEQLDAETARRVMTRFYDRMRAVVESHGGRVEKFIGDAVVAAFGIPELREDDALRAVRAAAAMVTALAELGDELERSWGVRLRMRTAVNTGELVVSREGLLVGDTMNTAARLEHAAGEGEVLVGESTWRLVRHAVELESLAELDLKGKALPARAWRLVSAAATDRRRTSAVEVRLVGRAGELTRLGNAFEGVLQARECRLVTVTGSPGVGKTRLAGEFGRLISDRASVVEGRCEPTGEGITFLPIAEVLRVVAGIGEADPAEIVREKLGALIPEEDPDRGRLVEGITAVLGFGEPASAQETFWAIRRGLESLARTRPVVLFLDDLHWGQPMLLDLVEHLIEWIRDAPVLIVALARPELRETREALAFTGRRARDVIELDPLDEDESQELVSGLLGDVRVPAALSERILETTEGNPLFLGETVRMLVDEGVLRREGDAWVAGDDVAAVEVPPTIQALLAARIERLRDEERAVVECAAVIGKQFYRGAVAELVTPTVRRGIDGHLEALRRKDMVEPDGSYWIDEPVYRFHHVLIRDAAYRSLLKEARAQLHERFADWMEMKAGELAGEHEEVIAFHLEQAHEYRRQLGPLSERDRVLGARAAERLHSAGRRALAREDLAAGANLLGRALAREAREEHEILWDLCEAVLSAGDTSTASELVARFAAGAGDDPGRRARATILEGQLANLTGAGQVAATAESVATAAAALGGLGDLLGEAKGYNIAAGAYARLGQVAAVEDSLDRALAAAREAGDRRRTTAVLAAAPRAALWGPSPVVRASGRCLDVVRILRMSPGNRHVEAVALRCQAVLEAMRGRADAAREILRAGRATLEELGLTLELHESAIHAGIVELLAGDPGAAAERLRSAREGFEALGVATGAAQAAALLARALVEQGGRDQEALEQTLFAEQHAGEDLKTTITWYSARAEALARLGDLEAATELARRAMSLAEPTDALADKAEAGMALARVLLAAGDAAGARAAGQAARGWYDAKGHVVGVERAGELAGSPRPAKAVPGAATELGGSQAARLETGTSERLAADFVDRFNAHDLEATIGLYREDFVMTDRRNVGWEVISRLDELRQTLSSSFAMAADMRFVFHEVIAGDDRVIAMRGAWVGTAADGGGEAELPVGMVTANDGRAILTTDIYEHDDDRAMIARYVELGGGLGALGDQPPERLLAQYARRFAARELEGMLELFAEDWSMVDHRNLGWEQMSGPDGFAGQRALWEASTDARLEIEEVLACDDHVIAWRGTYRGTAVEQDGGGVFEYPMGTVALIANGRFASSDRYDYDDREAMLARYQELGGRRSVARGERLPERYWTEYQRRYNAHDLDGLRELHAKDWVLVDHRKVGWGEVRGREAATAVLRSVFTSTTHGRIEFSEMVACDDRVIAVIEVRSGTGGEGAGELELPLGMVSLIENGQWIRGEVFEPDDRQAMIAGYAELGGGQGHLGERPPERYLAEFIRAHAARDMKALGAVTSDGFSFADHRPLGWDDYGFAGADPAIRAGWEASEFIHLVVDEVVACDDRVIAARTTWHGSMLDGGGRFEIPVALVSVVERGRCVSWDQYGFDDREAMLARYAELGGHRSVAFGDRPPERWYAEYLPRHAARDIDAALELYAEDFVMIDHRAVGWEEVHGLKALGELYESVFRAAPSIRVDIDQVLACDDRVIATRMAYRGEGRLAGEFEDPAGYVTVIEDGRAVSIDVYNHDDELAILRRYHELGGYPAALGTRPPERHMAKVTQRLAAGDLDGLMDLYAEDVVLVDHRALPWEDARGREGLRRVFEAGFGTFPDLWMDVDEVMACDDGVIAHCYTFRAHAADGGGETALSVGSVSRIENGLWKAFELFEPDDREAMLARYEELRGVSETEVGAGDRWQAPLAEYVTLVDRRPDGGGTLHGAEAVSAHIGDALSGAPLAATQDALLLLEIKGGFALASLNRAGEAAFVEIFGEQSSARAYYSELTEAPDAVPSIQFGFEWFSALNRRDRTAARACLADDLTVLDHRPVSAIEVHDAEAYLDLLWSLMDLSDDIRWWYTDPGRPGLVGRCSLVLTGRWNAGGGTAEIPVGTVFVTRDERFERIELYPPEQIEAMDARLAELKAQPADNERAPAPS